MENVKVKRIAKNTVFLYIRMLLIMGVTLFTSRILFQSLGEIDYGLNNVIAGVIVIFSYLNNSLAAASSRFIAYELGKENAESVENVFKTSFSIHFIFSIIVLLLAEIIGVWLVNNVLSIPENRIYACNWVYQFVVISAIVTIIQVPFNSLIIAQERMHVYAYIGIFDAVTRLLIAFAIWSTGYDKLILLGGLQLILALIVLFFYWAYCKRNFSNMCIVSIKYDKAKMKLFHMEFDWFNRKYVEKSRGQHCNKHILWICCECG